MTFRAVSTDFLDGLGQPDWVVIDLDHNRVEATFDGYFAERDARRLADDLNQEQVAMAAGEE